MVVCPKLPLSSVLEMGGGVVIVVVVVDDSTDDSSKAPAYTFVYGGSIHCRVL